MFKCTHMLSWRLQSSPSCWYAGVHSALWRQHSESCLSSPTNRPAHLRGLPACAALQVTTSAVSLATEAVRLILKIDDIVPTR